MAGLGDDFEKFVTTNKYDACGDITCTPWNLCDRCRASPYHYAMAKEFRERLVVPQQWQRPVDLGTYRYVPIEFFEPNETIRSRADKEDAVSPMSKKDYELIARVIGMRHSRAQAKGDDAAVAVIEELTLELSKEIAKANPNFDRVRFHEKCGLVE